MTATIKAKITDTETGKVVFNAQVSACGETIEELVSKAYLTGFEFGIDETHPECEMDEAIITDWGKEATV